MGQVIFIRHILSQLGSVFSHNQRMDKGPYLSPCKKVRKFNVLVWIPALPVIFKESLLAALWI